MQDKVQKFCEDFEKNGIAVYKNFATVAECDELIEKMKEITSNINVEEHIQNVFETESGIFFQPEKYFLFSSSLLVHCNISICESYMYKFCVNSIAKSRIRIPNLAVGNRY